MRWRLRKVLIAARGVVAARIVRACRDLGFPAVAVYDDADIWAPHAGLADEAYALPEGSGYDDIEAMIAIAVRSGADAIHPGDRQLAADPAAATAVRRGGLCWIGARPELLAQLTSAPVYRSRGPGEEPAERAQADLLAGASETVVLGTRLTAVTRRGVPVASHTAPRDTAAELGERARAVAGELGLSGYAAVEFERAGSSGWRVTGAGVRLTDAHAVVEEQAGVDIARAQLVLAFDPGAPLPQVRRDFWAFGVAVEAEDRARGALRAAGVVRSFRMPAGPGVRVDSALREGQVIVPSRDNRLAFVTVSASTETQARERLRRAAGEISVHGVTTAVWHPGEPAPADPAFTDVPPDTGIVTLEARDGSRVRLAFR